MTVATENAPEAKYARQQGGMPVRRPKFAAALACWRKNHDRYLTLRRLSDAEGNVETNPACEDGMQISALEAEIDDLERALEDAAMQMVVSRDAALPDIDAILRVLLGELSIRHQIDDSDLAVRLVLTVRRMLTGSVCARDYS